MKRLAYILAALVALAGVAVWYARRPPEYVLACQDEVRDKITAPRSARFPRAYTETPSLGGYVVRSFVDSRAGRIEWTCHVVVVDRVTSDVDVRLDR